MEIYNCKMIAKQATTTAAAKQPEAKAKKIEVHEICLRALH